MQQLTDDEWADIINAGPDAVIEIVDAALITRNMHGIAPDDVLLAFTPAQSKRRRVFIVRAELAIELGTQLRHTGLKIVQTDPD